jgi:divinyl chlorophyllide a 8-vinyl-reductase
MSSSTLSMSITNSKKRVVVVGATGYIGKFVAQESIRRGHDTVVIVRPGSNSASSTSKYFQGAKVVYGDVTNEENLKSCEAFKDKVDVVISCLASRSGIKEDSFLIDYQATLNSLNAGIAANADQFILLSAFCVRKPLLQFQKAKLKFEDALVNAQKNNKIAKYSIVRPTAFFKSVSGQFELLQQVSS